MHEYFPHGDFSRSMGEHSTAFSRVLFQQERPIADVDLNVIAELITRSMRRFFIDVIGPYGTAQTPWLHDEHESKPDAPEDSNFKFAFKNTSTKTETVTGVEPTLGRGFYYVQGLRCDFDPDRPAEGIATSAGFATNSQVLFSNVPHHAGSADLEPPYLVYLRVWERDVTALQDGQLRDPALNARVTDTTMRTQIVWQVIASRHMPKVTGALEKDCLELACLKLTSTEAFVRCWLEWEDKRSRSGRASIVLSRTPTYQPTNNLLYRVEVVEGGNEDSARFVWSRNNGCAQFRVLGQSGNTVTVGPAGGLVGAKPQKGQIVELLGPVPYAPGDARTTAAVVDDVTAAERVAGRQPAEPAPWKLTLDADLPGLGLGGGSRDVLRLWDGRFDAAEAATEQGRLLDDDVWVRVPNSQADRYIAGDHWLLTTRGIGNLDIDAQPRVVEDYVAPLALVLPIEADPVPTIRDLRSTFYPSAMWTVWDRSARKSHEDVDDDRHDDD